jgi:putative transposase
MAAFSVPPLFLSEDALQQLQTIAKSRSLPHSIDQRAQIDLV